MCEGRRPTERTCQVWPGQENRKSPPEIRELTTDDRSSSGTLEISWFCKVKYIYRKLGVQRVLRTYIIHYE